MRVINRDGDHDRAFNVQDEDIVTANVLHDLRVGWNVIGLRRQLSGLPLAAQRAALRVLAGISVHYRDNPLKSPPTALLDAVDMTIRAVASDPSAYRETLMALSGIRTMLFANAPPPDVTDWTVTGEEAKQSGLLFSAESVGLERPTASNVPR